MKKRALSIIIITMSICLIGCSNPMTQNNDTTSNNSSTENLSEESKDEISIDKAKEIAVKDAKLTVDEVTFIKAELDNNTDVKKYIIDFSFDNQEYDYEIGASDGKIISFNVEDKPNGDLKQTSDLSQGS